MATGPKWNRQRRCWYVQFWSAGGWKRRTVARGPRTWSQGDPEPKPPPEAYAEKDRLEKVEEQARERAAAGMSSALATFLDEHVGRYRKESTRRSVRETADQFLAFCNSRGITEFDQVDRKFCERWIGHLAGRYAINTVSRKRAQVAAAWGLRKKRGEITVNPWEGVEPKGKEITKERDAWTPKQFDVLYAEAADWLKDVLILGVHTGLRIEAMIRLEWRDILAPQNKDQKNGYVRVRKELDKAKKGYKVPISDRLKEMLDRLQGDPGRDRTFVLRGSRGNPIYNRNVTGTAIKRACARGGLAVPHSPNHHMRRTFGRWAVFGQLVKEKIPLYAVSKFLGHHSIKTTLIYLDIEEEDSARLMVPD